MSLCMHVMKQAMGKGHKAACSGRLEWAGVVV